MLIFTIMFKKALAIVASVATAIVTTAVTITNGVLTFGSGDNTLLESIVQAIISNAWNVLYFIAIPMVALGALYMAVRAVKSFVMARQGH